MSTAMKTVLIAGAQGVIGRAAADYLARQPGTTVYGISRRSLADLPETVRTISVDLLEAADCREKLKTLKDITHVVFAAYLERDNPRDRSDTNVALLRNLMDGVEASSAGSLRHVTLYQGGKAYGSDLGPFKTPAREDDPRLMPPNFYYDQEDHLRTRQVGKPWSFTIHRPEAVSGYAVGNPMNLTMVIAVYASISKELGLPLRFPGTLPAYRALYQVTSAEVLARATAWAGDAPAAANQIYNITNGDCFRWQFMWPRIARMFGMEAAEPVPMPLATYMADKGPLWDAMVKKYGLVATPYDQIVRWAFGDFIFNSEFDNVSSTIKARRDGFHDCIDTEEMFARFFEEIRRRRIIPEF